MRPPPVRSDAEAAPADAQTGLDLLATAAADEAEGQAGEIPCAENAFPGGAALALLIKGTVGEAVAGEAPREARPLRGQRQCENPCISHSRDGKGLLLHLRHPPLPPRNGERALVASLGTPLYTQRDTPV